MIPQNESHIPSQPNNLSKYFDGPISRRRMLGTLGGGLALAIGAGALGTRMARAATAQLPYVVLIVLDGAQPQYFDIPGIPHVQSLLRNGTRYTNAFAGILESETPSGHTSIATGSEPRANGVLSFWWANSANNEVSLFDPTKIRAGAMENIVRHAGVPTLAGRVHAQSPKAQVVALSGSKYYAADAIGGPDANVIMYFQGTATGQFAPTYVPGHAPQAGVLTSPGLTAKKTNLGLGVENHLAMNLAVATFQHTRQQVTLINLPEFDWPLGHVDGGSRSPQSVKTLMRAFDRDFAMLQNAYRKAGVLDRTIFVLMADHGMMPLVHTVDSGALRAAVLKAGTGIIADTYTSGAFYWIKNASRASRAARNIANLRNPYIQSVYARVRTGKGHVYARVTSAGLLRTQAVEGANQYLLRSFNGANAPDVVVLFTEGVGSEPGGQAHWKADHGGTSWQAQHIPLILSGPGIRAGYESSSPARLIDVAPTVLQSMGIAHTGMQGGVLADALKSPPAWATQQQKATTRGLMPVVQALQQESHAELAAGR
ncbi:MAG TPA: alkaline phosphatase family protein [Chloroflexota bacterium]